MDWLEIICSYTVQTLYNILHYNTDLDITRPCCGSQTFDHWILQRNYRKMTIKWSFSCNSFVKLMYCPKIYNDSFITQSIHTDSQNSVKCTVLLGSILFSLRQWICNKISPLDRHLLALCAYMSRACVQIRCNMVSECLPSVFSPSFQPQDIQKVVLKSMINSLLKDKKWVCL